jgi:putative ABC transport system ATP-binding protein
MENLIKVNNIYKTYELDGKKINALNGVSLDIMHGEFTAIEGPSGSGKSTLMNILGCLDTPTSGTYFLDGEDVSGMREKKLTRIRNRTIGFIFQSFNLISGCSALENVELPLIYRKVDKAKRRRMAEEALERVGLSDRMHHLPAQMSGGQQQRVAIARAIAAKPPIILADEPTGNLDPESGRAVMDILRELNKEGKTVILITHDRKIAFSAGRIIRLEAGRIAESEKAEAV